LESLLSHGILAYMNGEVHESAEISLNGIHHVGSDNLSYLHTGVETYNLYNPMYASRKPPEQAGRP